MKKTPKIRGGSGFRSGIILPQKGLQTKPRSKGRTLFGATLLVWVLIGGALAGMRFFRQPAEPDLPFSVAETPPKKRRHKAQLRTLGSLKN